MNEDELKHKAKLLEAYTRRKQQRELQLAKLGVNADPIISIEIEDLEREIEKLLEYFDYYQPNQSIIKGTQAIALYEYFHDYRPKEKQDILKRIEKLEEQMSRVVEFCEKMCESPLNKSEVRLVDASFSEEDILDIKVRNIGSQIAFLKGVKLTVLKIWNFEPASDYGRHYPTSYVFSTANYDIDLDLKEYPYSKNKSLAQSVPPNEVDRFTFTFGMKEGRSFPDEFPYVFLIEMKLLYDENDRELIIQNICLTPKEISGYLKWLRKAYFKKKILDYDESMSYYEYQEFLGDKFKNNAINLARKNIYEILKTDSIKNNKLQKIISMIYWS